MIENILGFLNSVIWSDYLVYLALLVGLSFTIISKCVQIRMFGKMFKLMFAKHNTKEGISSFQAFSVAVSGRVGTGNIAGVATAIAAGGPGAVFWMWIIAFLGASSAYVEATLGQIYKEKEGNQFRGGPAFYIEKGLNSRGLGLLFAVVTILSCGLFLPGVQSSSIATGINYAFNINTWVVGLVVAILLGLIIFGGIKRIANVAQIVVPFMAIIYIIVALTIIVMKIDQIHKAFNLIISSAMGSHQLFGGIMGAAISMGVKRGIYSNEAGQGTAPHAAAAASVKHPAQQGLVQAASVYVDTWFICTATALVIILMGTYDVGSGDEMLHQGANQIPGPIYTQMAIDKVFPGFGASFVSMALFFFAFTTIMAYYYMAETNLDYISKNVYKKGINIFRVIFLIIVFFTSSQTASFAWALGDIGVGLMAWINLIAIIFLAKPAFIALKDYEQQIKKDPTEKNITFDPKKLNIKNTSFW